MDTTSETGVPSTTIDKFTDYTPDLTPDFSLSRDALENAPTAISEGIEINPDHVDYSICQSRGFPVAAKTATVAGVTRYLMDEVATEDKIMEIAEDVLGNRRNARRHFEAIIDYFSSDPLNDLAATLDTDTVVDHDDLRVDIEIAAVAREDVYFVNPVALLEEHFQARLETKRQDVRNPRIDKDGNAGAMARSQGAIRFLADRSHQMIQFVFGSSDEFADEFANLADTHNHNLDELGVEQFDPVDRDPFGR